MSRQAIVNTAVQTEEDRRIAILNSFLNTPHGDLSASWEVHQQICRDDPLFYVRLAAWYSDHGDIRDHKELFVAQLCLSQFDGHRDTGLALLSDLPPYQVVNVFDFIHGKKTNKRVYNKPDMKAHREAIKKAYKDAGLPKIKKGQKRPVEQRKRANALVKALPKPPHKVEVVSFGLERTVPRSMRTEIVRYLKDREQDPDLFDGMYLSVRGRLKRLYSTLHIKPSERAAKILYAGEFPDDSRLAQFRTLAKSTDPTEQARIIVEHRIPFKSAMTLVAEMTPPVLLALVSVMSPQELINSLKMLKRYGALDNPTIKEQIDAKLNKAKKSKRVAGLKAQVAIDAADLGGDVEQKLQEVANSQVKAKGEIKSPTALLIDKSLSMSAAIDLGKQIAAMLSTVCTGGLVVYAFDQMPYRIAPQGTDLASWTRAMQGLKPAGSTSIGCALRAMEVAGERVEKLILVTDGGDNQHPNFAPAYQSYTQKLSVQPQVVFVKLKGDQDKLTDQCKAARIELETLDPTGADKYSLTNLIPLLSKATRLDLLLEIMATELPKRRPHEPATV